MKECINCTWNAFRGLWPVNKIFCILYLKDQIMPHPTILLKPYIKYLPASKLKKCLEKSTIILWKIRIAYTFYVHSFIYSLSLQLHGLLLSFVIKKKKKKKTWHASGKKHSTDFHNSIFSLNRHHNERW